MLRKRLALLFLFAAQIVVLGHCMVPHHHHTDLANQQHPHHHDHESDHHTNDSPLGIAFSGFVHAGEQATFTNPAIVKVKISRRVLQALDDLPSVFKFPVAYIFDYQKHTFPPDKQIRYRPPIYGTYFFRGPPVFIVA